MSAPQTETLDGQQFGHLTVLRASTAFVSPSGQRSPAWLCRCSCGVEKVVRARSLRSGQTTSCGAGKHSVVAHARRQELVGAQFGRLTVVEFAGVRWETLQWRCACVCGRTTVVRGSSLRSGATRSCGCLAIEAASAAKRKDLVRYLSAHDRVRTARGRARDQGCVDCGGPAVDWSYDGGDPNELREGVGGSVLAYSLDTDRYSPRCRSCHRRYDQRRRVSV